MAYNDLCTIVSHCIQMPGKNYPKSKHLKNFDFFLSIFTVHTTYEVP